MVLKSFYRYSVAALLVVCILSAVTLFLFINHKPVWSDYDEIAHFDYILRIEKGLETNVNDRAVQPEVLEAMKNTKWQRPDTFDGTAPGAGLAGFSYELHQPPLYYFVMSLGDNCIRFFQPDIIYRVKMLRLLSYFWFLAAIVLGYSIVCKFLTDNGYTSGVFFGLLYSLFLLVAGSATRYGISNDWFGLFWIHLCLWSILQPQNTRTDFLFYASSGLLALTKQTALPAILLLFVIRNCSGRLKFRTDLFPAFVLLPVCIWYVHFFKLRSEPSVIRGVFEAGIPSGYLDLKTFLIVWIADAADLQAFGISMVKPTFYLLILCVFAPVSLTALFMHSRMKSLAIICCLALLMVGGMMYTLNKWIPGVNWYAYRHYNMYGIFFFIALCGWLLSPVERLLTR